MNQTFIPALNFTEAINLSTSQILQFCGRARRSEYWWTMLAIVGVSIILTPFIGFFLDLATIPLTFRRLHDTGRSGWWWGAGAILKLIFIISLVYDIVMSFMNSQNMIENEENVVYTIIAKYSILMLLIFIHKIIMLVFMCIDSEQDSNEYGDSPKYSDITNDNTDI